MGLTMVVLAAGMGTRFGGPKQLVAVGPSGECILDYNAHDAAAAGFERIVLVTRPELEEQVSEVASRGVGRIADTRIVLQHVPEGREKPLGTADAVVAAAAHVDGPFGVANADDLYGPQAFRVLGEQLQREPGTGAVVGFRLGDTVPPTGAVSRALLERDDRDRVRRVVEVHGIHRAEGRLEAEGATLDPASLVSMNLWGLPEPVMGELGGAVDRFVAAGADGEVYLPEEVGRMLADGLEVVALRSEERWAGLTNPSDIDDVRAHAADRWASPLWEVAPG